MPINDLTLGFSLHLRADLVRSIEELPDDIVADPPQDASSYSKRLHNVARDAAKDAWKRAMQRSIQHVDGLITSRVPWTFALHNKTILDCFDVPSTAKPPPEEEEPT